MGANMLPSFGRLFVAWLKEGLAAVLRPFVLFPLLVLNAVEAILQLLGRVKGGEREERPRSRCTKVPEPIKRKPDPCLYSQPYLRSLGLAVQWNNPDIWLTDHSGALVDPTQLQRDTDYVVNVRIWNASFDPALATEVRCEYRFHSVITLPRPGKPLSKLLK